MSTYIIHILSLVIQCLSTRSADYPLSAALSVPVVALSPLDPCATITLACLIVCMYYGRFEFIANNTPKIMRDNAQFEPSQRGLRPEDVRSPRGLPQLKERYDLGTVGGNEKIELNAEGLGDIETAPSAMSWLAQSRAFHRAIPTDRDWNEEQWLRDIGKVLGRWWIGVLSICTGSLIRLIVALIPIHATSNCSKSCGCRIGLSIVVAFEVIFLAYGLLFWWTFHLGLILFYRGIGFAGVRLDEKRTENAGPVVEEFLVFKSSAISTQPRPRIRSKHAGGDGNEGRFDHCNVLEQLQAGISASVHRSLLWRMPNPIYTFHKWSLRIKQSGNDPQTIRLAECYGRNHTEPDWTERCKSLVLSGAGWKLRIRGMPTDLIAMLSLSNDMAPQTYQRGQGLVVAGLLLSLLIRILYHAFVLHGGSVQINSLYVILAVCVRLLSSPLSGWMRLNAEPSSQY